MKKIMYLIAVVLLSQQTFAQTDTTFHNEPDTIKVGNFIIIKKKDNNKTDSSEKSVTVNIDMNKSYKKHKSNLSTNWFIVDLGFANLRDNTVYGSPEANAYLHDNGNGHFTKGDMDLINGKTSNVNLWIFMQKLNVINHVVNLKYGLGLEMYNWRYSSNISYSKSPDAFVYRDTINFSKNKLATDYITIPLMINIDPTPDKKRGFSFSAGVSAGYLYNARNKQISNERGKQKIRSDFDLNPWRIAYIAEMGLGPVRVYGSYSVNPLHDHGLVQYPYAIGLRLSNW